MQTLDDMKLLREYTARNSETAFEALVSRHVNLVYSAALRQVRDPHQAQEITQAVFIILARKAAKIREGAHLTGWLFKTTRFVALAHQRETIKRQRREQELPMQTPAPENEPDPFWIQASPLLDQALAGLGEKDRQALLLRFFENRTFGQVGGTLGAGEDAARKRIDRALEKLRRFFLKRGVACTTAMIAGTMAANSVQAAPAALIPLTTAAATTQGAAVSASVLTLIKGGLKLMAWAKIKMATATGAAVILAATTTAVAVKTVYATQAGKPVDISGAWQGVLEVPQTKMKTRVVLKIAGKGGDYVVTADLLDRNMKDVPVSRFQYNHPSLRAEADTPGGPVTYEAVLNAEGTELSGMESQSGSGPVPLVLVRTAQPDTFPEPLNVEEYAPRRDSEVQGYWKGSMKTGGHDLPIAMKIAHRANGAIEARVDIAQEGLWNIPALVTYDRPRVRVVAGGIGSVFDGTLSTGLGRMTGTWTMEAKRSFQTTMTRTDPEAEAAREKSKDYRHTSPEDLQGHWTTTLARPGGGTPSKLRFVLHVGKMPDGTYAASLDSPDTLGIGIEASSVQFTAPNVRVESREQRWAFLGKLEKGRLVGRWRQGGGAVPVTFERND